MTEEVQNPVDMHDVVQRLVMIYTEISVLDDDAKVIVKEAKDAGLDAASLVKIAKAKAAAKLGELEDKTSALISLIEELK
jgi:uncharacterized protein (UPF0335 family)